MMIGNTSLEPVPFIGNPDKLARGDLAVDILHDHLCIPYSFTKQHSYVYTCVTLGKIWKFSEKISLVRYDILACELRI